jgi:hypothetical protein
MLVTYIVEGLEINLLKISGYWEISESIGKRKLGPVKVGNIGNLKLGKMG